MTTQLHPEPSKEASSLPVAGYLDETTSMFSFHSFIPSSPLVRLADAQSQLTAMRAERDAAISGCEGWKRERDSAVRNFYERIDRWDAADKEVATLKAERDEALAKLHALQALTEERVEGIMALAEQYARACTLDERVTVEHMGMAAEEIAEAAMNVARSALRAAVESRS